MLPSGPGGVRKSLLRRTQLSTSLHVRQTLQKSLAAHEGFSPAVADCGRQGTATSPPSTTSFISRIKRNESLFLGWNRTLRIMDTAIPYKGSPASLHWILCIFGGEGGIRTHGTLMRYTRSPGVPIQPALAPLRLISSAWTGADKNPLPAQPFGRRWRRERDLNPRGTFWAPNRFRVDRLRPLGHPS